VRSNPNRPKQDWPQPTLVHSRTILWVLRTIAIIFDHSRAVAVKAVPPAHPYVVALVLALLATAAGQSLPIDECASKVSLSGKTYAVVLIANSVSHQSAVLKLKVIEPSNAHVDSSSSATQLKGGTNKLSASVCDFARHMSEGGLLLRFSRDVSLLPLIFVDSSICSGSGSSINAISGRPGGGRYRSDGSLIPVQILSHSATAARSSDSLHARYAAFPPELASSDFLSSSM
jgi:hypothetical protein